MTTGEHAAPGRTNVPAPAAEPGTVEDVNVLWLLRSLRASTDISAAAGDRLLATLVRDKIEGPYLGDLIHAVTTEGFTVPIECSLTPRRLVRLGNGHHRLVAAILLVADTIPVFWNPNLAGDDDGARHTCAHRTDSIQPAAPGSVWARWSPEGHAWTDFLHAHADIHKRPSYSR